MWNKHEREEHERFDSTPFHIEAMLLERDRQLRGHWRVLKRAVRLRDPLEMKVSLDTDGRMLYDKVRNHIQIEEELLHNKSLAL